MPRASVVRLPPNPKVEIEFTPGVWTDVRADVETYPQVHYGRTSEFSQPQVGDFSVSLRNYDKATRAYTGKYVPQNQASIYWPNVVARKRIRYSYNPGTQRWRFFGYIKEWQPQMLDGDRSVTVITAKDRDDQFSRVKLLSPIRQATRQDGVDLLWPLTEDQDSTTAAEQSGHGGPPLRVVGTGTAPTFGDNGPGVGDGTGVKFTPGSASSGQLLSGAIPPGTVDLDAFTIEVWVNAGTSLPSWATTGDETEIILGIDDPNGNIAAILYLFQGKPSFESVGALINASASIADGGWHHIAATRASAGGAVTLYADGVSAGSSVSSTSYTDPTAIMVGDSASPNTYTAARFQGNVGYVAVYDHALSSTRIAEHAAATTGFYGDTTDARIARWLGAAGLTASDWDLDTGVAVVNTYPQDGKDVLGACQDIAANTEGGGAAFYITPDGKARFTNRHSRYTTVTPVLTLDAVSDLDPSTYTPSYDDAILVDQVTVDRASSSGTQSTQTHTDTELVATYGVFADQITTYTTSDQDALNLAQYLAAHSRPGLRFPQIAVNLATAGHDLYDAIGQVQIGDRIRLTNIPTTAYSHTTLDLFVEGWTETAGLDSYTWVADVTAADNPAVMILDDPVYGRLQCDGQTLTSTIAAADTSLSITTAAGKPTFTTTSARYPLQIQIGEEIITLNSAPGGATSPQSFTGVTRGDKGTQKATQTAGSTVNLWPAVTLAL